MNKFKEKWQIKSNSQFIIILIVFAITGSTAAYLSKPLTNSLGITRENLHGLVYWPLRLLLLFPIYQVLLVLIGTLLGQFKFFWAFEKQMLYKMKLGFIAEFVDKKMENKNGKN